MQPTPTENADLPLRLADFGSLAEALDYAARGATGINFYNARGQLTATRPYSELRRRALGLARRLAGLGLPRGSRILAVGDTWPGFAEMFFAAQYAGLLATPVSLPAGLGGKDAYIEQLRRQLATSGARAALASDEMADFLAEAADASDLAVCGPMARFEALPESAAELRPLGPDEGCYIQFSSGSTRFPLGVDIRQRALLANIRAIVDFGLGVRRGDRAASWLPLYHDMGLIGFLLAPICTQTSVDLTGPREFARRPLQWLKLISDNRATISYSPSFGYDVAARRAQTQSIQGLDLSCWRAAGIGADMIQPPLLERFAAAFAPAGFDPRAYVASYGMAETCVAASFAPRGVGIVADIVDRDALAAGEARAPASGAAGRTFVLCGRPIPDHALEVRDAGGATLPDRRVGRIFVRGPSVMAGYLGQPEATAAVLSPDGWLDTGDLGYLLDGQIVVTGRAKDLIIVNGRNVWPQDIEWAAEALPALRRGDAAAFSLDVEDGAEKVVVLAVARVADAGARTALALDIAGAVKEATGVDASVRLVSPAIGLPMTSSGKLSRTRAKQNFLDGLYGAPVAGPA